MAMGFQWLTKEAGAEAVGRTRALCYAPGAKEIEVYQKRLAEDGRVVSDDLLIAHRDGQAVGTATSYSMSMWARGSAFDCQAVAWVGTVKTHRRSGGIATQIMHQVLRKARERRQVLSALLPFRASYYDHFGYGSVERRANWTIPLSILPSGPTDGFSFITGADESRRACRQRMVQAGQCDLERPAGFWDHWSGQENDGYVVADMGTASEGSGTMRSYFVWHEEDKDHKKIVSVFNCAFDSVQALRRALCFFGTMRDQYSAMTIALPVDLPLNRLLKEPQVMRLPLNHATAELRVSTRMQVRVLDHARLMAGLHLPHEVRCGFFVAIGETEGHVSRLRIELEGGRATATPATGEADIECSDRDWAAMVLGDCPASRMAELGLIKAHSAAAVRLLDAFAAGPVPFCNEYF